MDHHWGRHGSPPFDFCYNPSNRDLTTHNGPRRLTTARAVLFLAHSIRRADIVQYTQAFVAADSINFTFYA